MIVLRSDPWARAVRTKLRALSGYTVFVESPRVERNPNDRAPLVFFIQFSTDVPVSPVLEISSEDRQWSYRPAVGRRRDHRLALVGLRAGQTHQIRVVLKSSGGWLLEESEPLTVETPPLPDDFPPLETVVSKPEKMEPGVTLFVPNRWKDNVTDMDFGYITALDEQGEVVWYYESRHRTADLRLLKNGNLLYNFAAYYDAIEVDWLGNIVHWWHANNLIHPPTKESIPLNADTLHHEVLEMPSGNLLALTTELRKIVDYPSSETDPDSPPEDGDVVGDVIIEFTRSGDILHRWHLLDLLDPYRIGYGSLSDFWKAKYNEQFGVKSLDWSHANAICYDEENDAFIVSVRHQDCLVKIDRQSGRLVWILGNPEGWRAPWRDYLLQPRGDLEWPYHQHGPQLTPAGTILLYDNGNYRATPFEPKTSPRENYSRVVEYRVDETEMIVTQVWEYRENGDHPSYCPLYGEADWMPQTGNILITDGGHIETEKGIPSNTVPSDYQWARILEVTHDTPAEKVFEVRVDSGPESTLGWSIYRSQRLPDTQTLSDLVR